MDIVNADDKQRLKIVNKHLKNNAEINEIFCMAINYTAEKKHDYDEKLYDLLRFFIHNYKLDYDIIVGYQYEYDYGYLIIELITNTILNQV